MGWIDGSCFFFRKSQFFSVAFSHLGFVMHGRYHQQIFLKHNLRMCLLACAFLSMSSFFSEVCFILWGDLSWTHYCWSSWYLDSITHAQHLNQSWAQRLFLFPFHWVGWFAPNRPWISLPLSFLSGVTRQVQHNMISHGWCPTYLPLVIFHLITRWWCCSYTLEDSHGTWEYGPPGISENHLNQTIMTSGSNSLISRRCKSKHLPKNCEMMSPKKPYN